VISTKAVELAALMMAAARETSGEWFVSPSSGAVAERSQDADPKDVEYYGGVPICESAMPSTALTIVVCQPNNIRVVCSELLRIANDERRAIGLKQATNEHVIDALRKVREALSHLEDAINDDIPF
jgi:hypothetical protein